MGVAPARDSAFGLVIFLIIVVVVVGELGHTFNARYSVLVFAGVITALFFHMAAGGAGGVTVMNRPLQDSIEVATPFGTVKAWGGDKLLLFVIAAVVSYFAYEIKSEQAQLGRIEANLARNNDAIAEFTYVISLSQVDREKLNLSMPESLRRKMKTGRE